MGVEVREGVIRKPLRREGLHQTQIAVDQDPDPIQKHDLVLDQKADQNPAPEADPVLDPDPVANQDQDPNLVVNPAQDPGQEASPDPDPSRGANPAQEVGRHQKVRLDLNPDPVQDLNLGPQLNLNPVRLPDLGLDLPKLLCSVYLCYDILHISYLFVC